MKITVSFKQLEHTPSLDEKIHEKSQKLMKYFEGNTEIRWTCYAKGTVHYAEISCIGAKSFYQAHAESDDLYKSLDLVVAKIEKQLAKRKTKMKNKIHRKKGNVIFLEPVDAWLDHDESDEAYDDVA